MNSPFGPNSSSCAAVGAYAGPPALFERVKTKTCPFELTATPGTSPKFVPAGSLRKSALESNGMSGTLCCATAGTAASRNRLSRTVFITPPRVDSRGHQYGVRRQQLRLACRNRAAKAGVVLAPVSRMTYAKHVFVIPLLILVIAPPASFADQGRGRGHANG